MGVSPTFPSEKYGYIVPLQNNRRKLYSSKSFYRKTIRSEAKDLIDQNALWNCGVFAFKLEFIISLLEEKGLPIQYEELLKQYQSLEKISFDYAVVEKAEKIVALPYRWKLERSWYVEYIN